MPLVCCKAPFVGSPIFLRQRISIIRRKESRSMQRNRGFTLIELMIVVAVVAILAAVAIPAYNQYVARSKLTEAFSGLSAMSVAAQQYYQDNRTYLASGGGATTCPVAVPSAKDYGFSCSNVSATTFLFTATPANGFVGPSYTIDQDGAKTTSNAPS
ncbi:MAG: type IV pilin protein, partial [Thiomonas sp.]